MSIGASCIDLKMALEREDAAKTVITLSSETTPRGEYDSHSAIGAGAVNHGVESVDSRGHGAEAQLWTRLEQQSTLIAMLKGKNDETLREVR